MKLYADSADLTTVIPLLEEGLVHGVTMNPTIIDRDGLTTADLPHLHDELQRAGAREIFMQATGADKR